MTDTAAYGQTDYGSAANDYNSLEFVIRQLLALVRGSTLVTVVSCTNTGGVSPIGTVNVIPLVNQMTGNREGVPHGTLFSLPYQRVQGGANAVILDPQPGDVGVAVFADRDISSVTAAADSAIANSTTLLAQNPTAPGVNPGSYRQNDWADGIYLYTVRAGTPTQYVLFSSAGISLVSPTTVTIQAPNVNINASTAVTITTPSWSSTGDGTIDGVNIKTHQHTGVSTGSSQTGPPA